MPDKEELEQMLELDQRCREAEARADLPFTDPNEEEPYDAEEDEV